MLADMFKDEMMLVQATAATASSTPLVSSAAGIVNGQDFELNYL